MYPPAGRRGSFLLVAILLLISIGLEQCCIVRIIPWLSDLGSVQPMIVFLDIPVRAPVPIDWIPVGFIFIFFYSIVYLPRRTHRDAAMKREMQKKLWSLLTRWWLLLVCILAGGGLFYELSDYLPRQVRNGIDSFASGQISSSPTLRMKECICRQHDHACVLYHWLAAAGEKAEMPAPAAMAPQERRKEYRSSFPTMTRTLTTRAG